MSPAGSGSWTWLFSLHPVAHFPRQGAGAEPVSCRSARAGAPPPLSKARRLPCAPTVGIFSITSPPVPASLQEPVGWARELASRLLGPGKARAPPGWGERGERGLAATARTRALSSFFWGLPYLGGAGTRKGRTTRPPHPPPGHGRRRHLGTAPWGVVSPRGTRHLRQPPGVPPPHPVSCN